MTNTIRNLLGPDVLLLAWPKGIKGTRRLWGHLTVAKDMSDPKYLRELDRAENIGVALGRVSGGLCSIDIDNDDMVEPFLQRNPVLRDTLRTKGQRGCNLWIRIKGEYPKKFQQQNPSSFLHPDILGCPPRPLSFLCHFLCHFRTAKQASAKNEKP